MIHRVRHQLTYANVMATIAVFIALGGGAYAAIKVPKNSVGTSQLKQKAVSNSRIRSGAVTSSKIAKSTVASLRGKAGPAGAAGPQGPATARVWAKVAADGAVVASSGGVIPLNTGVSPGAYELQAGDLRACALTASVNSTIGSGTRGFASVVDNGNNGVVVGTYDQAGTRTPLPFSVAAYC